MLFGIRTQGVASLALGYALVGLSARALSVVPQGKRLLAFSPCIIGCTSAIQASLIAFGLCDNSARPCLNQKLILSHGCVESQSTRPEGQKFIAQRQAKRRPGLRRSLGFQSASFAFIALCASG